MESPFFNVASSDRSKLAKGVIVRRDDLNQAIAAVTNVTTALKLGRITNESAVPYLQDALILLNNLTTKNTGSAVN